MSLCMYSCIIDILPQSFGYFGPEAHPEVTKPPDPSDISIRRKFRKPRISIKKKKLILRIYLMGPYNAGPNFTPAPLTPALIMPVSKIPFPPFRAGVKRAVRYIY